MLFNEIVSLGSKAKVFFDMDGTLTEFVIFPKLDPDDRLEGFYDNLRPLKQTVEKAKVMHENGVELHILSSCFYPNHREDKIKWLEQHLPFIKKENIHIIVYKELEFQKADKYFLKSKILKEYMEEGKEVFLIEDDHRIIKNTRQEIPNARVYHMTSLVD